MTSLNGVLPVDKPEGPTSHDVVARARRALRERRIGHTGTLDPFASGLLLLCVGPATRLAEYLSALPKRYTATLRLGAATDTDDATGAPISSSEGWRELDEARIRAALLEQVGPRLQLPPVYSAKKVAGERAHAAARRGETVTRTPVEVVILSIEVRAVRPPDVDFDVECSSGTYIRAIARDAGEALGVGAHLTRLRRTRVGRFDVEAALPVERLDDGESVEEAMIAPAAALSHLPSVPLDEAGLQAIRHGRAVPAVGAPEGVPVALLAPSGDVAAIAECADGVARPRKVFA